MFNILHREMQQQELPLLSVERLRRSPARCSQFYTVHQSANGTSGFSTPVHTRSAPSSPRSCARAYNFSVEEDPAPLGEVFAAIPFSWEEVPGTPSRIGGQDQAASDQTSTHGDAAAGSSSSSSSRSTVSSTASDSFSRTDSEQQLYESTAEYRSTRVSTGIMIMSSDGECSITPPSAAFEFNYSARRFHAAGDDQAAGEGSSASASPIALVAPAASCISSLDEFLISEQRRSVPILRLPPRLQRQLDTQVVLQPSTPLSSSSPSSSSDHSKLSLAWSSFNKRCFRSPATSQSPTSCRSPASRSPARSDASNTNNPVAADSMTDHLRGQLQLPMAAGASENENQLDSSPGIQMLLSTKGRRTSCRRLDRRGHRSSRSISPLRRFKHHQAERSEETDNVPPAASSFATHELSDATNQKSSPKKAASRFFWPFSTSSDDLQKTRKLASKRNISRPHGTRSTRNSSWPRDQTSHDNVPLHESGVLPQSAAAGSQHTIRRSSKPKPKLQSQMWEAKTKEQMGTNRCNNNSNNNNPKPAPSKGNLAFSPRGNATGWGILGFTLFARKPKSSSRSTISPSDLHIPQEEWGRIMSIHKLGIEPDYL
ncbi:hypothetical protein CY35_17G037400 [Sphagnum magellanicum]|nr:hypothetical protein CY35_17G037400 [Sphagnum magellanicum]